MFESLSTMNDAGEIYSMAAGHYPTKSSWVAPTLDTIYRNCRGLVIHRLGEDVVDGPWPQVEPKFDEATARDMLGLVAAIWVANGNIPEDVWLHFKGVMRSLKCAVADPEYLIVLI